MTELVLSTERRNELLALLRDKDRFRTEYPTVSEYLDAAPALAGTGNAEIDAAFDLRFVHYAVSGGVMTGNPYWDIVAPCVFEHDGRQVVNGGSREGSARLAYAEMALQSIYAYAVPSPETITWAVGFCAGRPVVEVGAGRGYWAAQLTRAELSVDAFDSAPPDGTGNLSFVHAAGQIDVWHPVAPVGEFADCLRGRAEHVLLLCWPPGWGDTMASEVLAAFEQTGGSRLMFIGEPKGGKTADDAFFDALSSGWRLASEDRQFVSWWNLSDVAQGWVRR